ncbi:MAG: hypothetical protein K8I82_26365 [Anaerolineae bacterium]|nr:hypothetical protein [Anaerolineae bacterium]
MLTLSLDENPWDSDSVELNMSFDTLRDYQWERLLKALWSYPIMFGPLKSRYTPGSEPPSVIPMSVPDPTAAMCQFAAVEVVPKLQVGAEVWITRSLFECVSVTIPLKMFKEVTTERTNEGLLHLEQMFLEMALTLYVTTTYTIAAIGVNRGCQLLMEMLANPQIREDLIKTGNFLARDDAMAELRLHPQNFQEVRPSLRWCPPKS